MTFEEIFKRLSNIDISNYIEYGGPEDKFRFLSWAKTWELLVKEFPDSSYEVRKNAIGLPYFRDENEVAFVFTKVTVSGYTLEMWLPVQDESFNPISKPNSAQINKSIMRCLVKNIAMFGLGLSLYTEEKKDLVTQNTESTPNNVDVEKVYQELMSRGKTREEVAAMNPESWNKDQYDQFMAAISKM